MSSRYISLSALWLLLVSTLVSTVQASTCVLPDNGTGTIDLPPGCPDGYQGPMATVDGLPTGTTIEIAATLTDLANVVRFPGGSLGGEVEQFDASLLWLATGTGALAGYSRTLSIPVAGEMHTAPRTPGDPVQAFPADLFRLEGELFGDPDFCMLRVRAGTDHGLPSPGHTTLTRLPTGDFAVDSFFDITYRIEFEGCPGSPLEDFAGATTGSERFQAGEPSTPTGLVAASAPRRFGLAQNRPNPFNPTTTIEYDVPAGGGAIAMAVYDARGRLVRVLADEEQAPGRRSVLWDGTDDGGRRVASGIYFYVLRTERGEMMRKLAVLK